MNMNMNMNSERSVSQNNESASMISKHGSINSFVEVGNYETPKKSRESDELLLTEIKEEQNFENDGDIIMNATGAPK